MQQAHLYDNPNYVSNTSLLLKSYCFQIHFLKNYLPLGRQHASSIGVMYYLKVAAAPKLCFTVGDPRRFMWKRAMWLAAKHTVSTLLTLR